MTCTHSTACDVSPQASGQGFRSEDRGWRVDEGVILSDHADGGERTGTQDWSSRVSSLAAPRADGAKLIEPPIERAGKIAAANREVISRSDYDVQGRPLNRLAEEARTQLLAAAGRYTRGYRDVEIPSEPAGVFLAGHQPEMFHPGVWYKNFALSEMAARSGGVAVNLQIDSDAMKSASLRVPGGSAARPRLEAIAFDRAVLDLPYEQREILDRSTFESFGSRAAAHLRSLVPDPLLERYWPRVVARSRETDNLGACIAQARHQIEADGGLATLEIPQCSVCELPAVRWFIVHLLANLPRLWEVYNTAIAEYRKQHRIRSASHPAPELTAEGDWLEAPLWIWTADEPARRRLFVRQRGDELVISDRAKIELSISITAEGDATRAVEQLADASRRGIRLRTRALVTTLAARLLLGDMFVHGIGGAKYDLLTDTLISRFFGLQSLGYMVVSGTLRLPISRVAAGPNELRALRQRVRELQYHPERFIDGATGDASTGHLVDSIVAEKRRWIETPAMPTGGRERCRAIRRANEALQPAVESLRQKWSAEAERLATALRCEAILASRDYAFALFPQLTLTNFFTDILEKSGRSG